MKSFSLILITTTINVINANDWYDIQDAKLGQIRHHSITMTTTTTTTNNNNAIKPITAQSSIECTLKCRTMHQKQNVFYTENEKQCFCLHNNNNNGGNMIIIENGDIHGKFISSRSVAEQGISYIP